MESTFLLHAASGDERLLGIGAALHQQLRDRNRVACGYASVGDVSTGQLEVGLGWRVGRRGWLRAARLERQAPLHACPAACA